VKVVSIQQAQAHLSRLVEQAVAGEEIVIIKAGRLCVQLTPCASEQAPRTLGGWEGELRIARDFDHVDARVIGLFEGGMPPDARKARAKRRKRA